MAKAVRSNIRDSIASVSISLGSPATSACRLVKSASLRLSQTFRF